MVIVVENQSFRDEIVDNFKKDLRYNGFFYHAIHVQVTILCICL
jgi:hypothetical protein